MSLLKRFGVRENSLIVEKSPILLNDFEKNSSELDVSILNRDILPIKRYFEEK